MNASISIEDVSTRASHSITFQSARHLGIPNNLSAFSLCCAYAREAAAEGRLLAAHHSFQRAVGYFDRVQNIVVRCQKNSFDSDKIFASSATVYDALQAARAELDDCAQSVYFGVSQRPPAVQTSEGDSQ